MFIYNANIYTMDNGIIENGYVEILDGKIAKVKSGAPEKIFEGDIDACGKLLLPGFIDAHTHLGIIGDSVGFESDDCNEETDPVTPHLRSIDAINPFDRGFEEARAAGVTTVLTAPGSANAVCGGIYALKTEGKRIDDMVIKQVAMKFALGENPKSVYNSKNEAPITRMATAALIREALFKAKKYAVDIENAQENEDFDEPEFDIKNEALLPVLSGEISAHFHAHRADDICTAIRICKEFGLNCVIVHATEGHKIADILAEENISAIIGPIICDRSKPELRQLEVKNSAILAENGVRISLCTDHPEIPIQYLAASGAVAVKGGLDRMKALEALTISPAKICGIDDTVGSITTGKDADILLFDSDPLDIITSPCLVMINGEIVFCR